MIESLPTSEGIRDNGGGLQVHEQVVSALGELGIGVRYKTRQGQTLSDFGGDITIHTSHIAELYPTGSWSSEWFFTVSEENRYECALGLSFKGTPEALDCLIGQLTRGRIAVVYPNQKGGIFAWDQKAGKFKKAS